MTKGWSVEKAGLAVHYSEEWGDSGRVTPTVEKGRGLKLKLDSVLVLR